MPTIQEIILVLALIGVVGVWVLGRFGKGFSRSGRSAAATDQRIRGLEAELRVVQRKASEVELVLEHERETLESLRRDLSAANSGIGQRDDEIDRLRGHLTEECGKTQSLRQELADRAEETIRASVRVKDAETELSVVRAGSDAVLEQVQKLAAERAELTDRIEALESEVVAGSPPRLTRLPVGDARER
ncbi:MAG: hypothetical protein FJ197_02025 [Gammaproteobacteria bacterium]|nr:hypothetical protein [Gammaproteobacteria bacterium]